MWAAILLAAASVAGMTYLILWEKRASRTWTVAAEGAFDRMEHSTSRMSRRSGAMVHTTTHYTVHVTRVHLMDGTSVACWGRLEPEWARGTRIRILKNGLGSHKLEKVEEP